MPIYEYECQDCQERFEQLTGMEADPCTISCPVCQGNNHRRLISTFGFKGSTLSSVGSSKNCSSCSSSNCSSC